MRLNLTFLKHIFAGFLRTRHFGRHFRRLTLLESVAGTGISRDLPSALSQELIAAATSDADALLIRLESHVDGLTESHAGVLRERYGLNEIEHEKPLPWWLHLWHCYKNPFNLLLTALAIVSYVTEDMKATTVILSMVILSTTLRFWQEAKSNKAADKLKAMVDVADGDDRHHHGYRYFPTDGSNRPLFQAASAASQFFPDSLCDIAGVHGADTTGKGLLLPPLWLAVADF